MKQVITGFFIFSLYSISAQYAPPAGQVGTTAIHKDSSAIIAWATGAEIERGLINIGDPSAEYEGNSYASFGTAEEAMGVAEGNSSNIVSLGDGGIATLTFENPIRNGEGYDFCVFENSFSETFLELAFVEVSSDGGRFVRFPAVSLTQTDTQVGGFGSIDATKIHNLAGKYKQGYGTPFDLNDLVDSTGIDLENITHVRIIDVVGAIDPQYATYDSQGNPVNDPFPTPFNSGGFDLDGVGVIHESLGAGIEEETTAAVAVYPNPFTDKIVVTWENDTPVTMIRLLDLSGKVMVEETVASANVFSTIIEGEAGLYLLEVEGVDFRKTVKLIKQY